MMFMKAVLKSPSTLYYCINFVDLYGYDVRPLTSDGGSEATHYI